MRVHLEPGGAFEARRVGLSSSVTRLSLPAFAGLIAVLAFLAWSVATFPIHRVLVGSFLAAYALAIWRRPELLVAAIPFTLPLFDLAPWSGRFYFDEFDFVLLISIAVGYARAVPGPGQTTRDRVLLAAVALVGLSYVVGIARGLLPWHMPDSNAFNNYYSPTNALRIAKSVLWAFLLYGVLGRFAACGRDVRRVFALGALGGLAGVVTVIAWERATFPGLFDFSDSYRVTGPFSQMHTGGADVECYLTVAAPFLVLILLRGRSWATRLAGAALLLGATYAVMVTFSRVGYAGYGLALALVLVATLAESVKRPKGGPLKQGAAALALAALALAVAVPIVRGPFAQYRMSQTGTDLGARQAHWADALRMRDPGWAASLFGMGVGSYPKTHFLRSEESHAATYRLGSEADNLFLRLGSGDSLYMEQFIALKPQQKYSLSLSVRSDNPNAHISVSICEKWLLTSLRCVFTPVGVTGIGVWQDFHATVASGDMGSGPWYSARPVKLSLYNSTANSVADVDNVRLLAQDGADLLANGDFSLGLDRWFFSVDNDKPWHVWSLPVAVLFEQGWLGIVALGLFAAFASFRAGRNALRGDSMAGAMLAAMAGFLVLGSLDSLIDSPRLLLMFLLLAWFCGRGWGGEPRGASAPPRNARKNQPSASE